MEDMTPKHALSLAIEMLEQVAGGETPTTELLASRLTDFKKALNAAPAKRAVFVASNFQTDGAYDLSPGDLAELVTSNANLFPSLEAAQATAVGWRDDIALDAGLETVPDLEWHTMGEPPFAWKAYDSDTELFITIVKHEI